jgi:hypothetical protein
MLLACRPAEASCTKRGVIFGGLTVSPVRDLNNPELLSEGSYSPFLSSSLGTWSGTWSQSVNGAYGRSGGNVHSDRTGEGALMPSLDREKIFLSVDQDLTESVTVYGQVVCGSNVTIAPASRRCIPTTIAPRCSMTTRFCLKAVVRSWLTTM